MKAAGSTAKAANPKQKEGGTMKKMMTWTAIAGLVLALAPAAMADITASGTLTPSAATWESGALPADGIIGNDGSVTVDGSSGTTALTLGVLTISASSGNATLTIQSGGTVTLGSPSSTKNLMVCDNAVNNNGTLIVTGTGSAFIAFRGTFGRGTGGTGSKHFEITDGAVWLQGTGGWYFNENTDLEMSHGTMGIKDCATTTLSAWLSNTDGALNTYVYYKDGGVDTQLTGSTAQDRFAMTRYNAGNSTPQVLDGTATPVVAPTWNGLNWVLYGVIVDGYTFLYVLGESDGGGDPTITLDGAAQGWVSENRAIGTVVGTLSMVNADTWTAPVTYTWNGGTDDGSFTIDGTSLKTAEIFDYEMTNSYSIDILATDSADPANSTNKQFTISIVDVSEPGGVYALGEVASGQTLAGTLQAHLASGDTSATYGVNAAAYHGAMFEIGGTGSDELHLKAAPEAGAIGDEYFVEVTATGVPSGLYAQTILVKVTVVSGAPKGTVFIFR